MTTTTTVRSAATPAQTSRATTSAAALSPTEMNDRIGAILMTVLVASFFAVAAVAFWMASSVHV